MSTQNGKLQKFLVLSTSRTGSNWLIDLLNSHPEIRAFEEVFIFQNTNNQIKVAVPDLLPTRRFYEFQHSTSLSRPWATFKYIDELYEEGKSSQAVGYKLMYGQLKRLPEILWKLLSDRYRIIHLMRQNLLDSILSRELAKQRKLWHSTKNVEVKKVRLDPQQLLSSLQRDERQVQRIRQIFRWLPVPILEVFYEQLRENTETTLESIAQFLNVSHTDIQYNSHFTKINSAKHWESIENYDEVMSTLENTRYLIHLQRKE